MRKCYGTHKSTFSMRSCRFCASLDLWLPWQSRLYKRILWCSLNWYKNKWIITTATLYSSFNTRWKQVERFVNQKITQANERCKYGTSLKSSSTLFLFCIMFHNLQRGSVLQFTFPLFICDPLSTWFPSSGWIYPASFFRTLSVCVCVNSNILYNNFGFLFIFFGAPPLTPDCCCRIKAALLLNTSLDVLLLFSCSCKLLSLPLLITSTPQPASLPHTIILFGTFLLAIPLGHFQLHAFPTAVHFHTSCTEGNVLTWHITYMFWNFYFIIMYNYG